LAFRQKAPELLPAAFFKGKRLEVGLNLLPFGNLTTWGSHIKPLTVESDRERVSPPSGQLLKKQEPIHHGVEIPFFTTLSVSG
jgi:hypothetical protein